MLRGFKVVKHQDGVIRDLAKAIYAKVIGVNRGNLYPRHRTILLRSISADIRGYTDCLVCTPPHVSAAAQKAAEKLGINLWSTQWHDQPKFDKRRSVFHFEHMVPVEAVRKDCLK